ncbi:MAG: hypothetical protein NUK65_02545 [Firmicutes bacterium]|nr:hypothetical protein [Bacillota bacterium]
MVYFILVFGVFLSLYAFFAMDRESKQKGRLSTEPLPPFQDAFPEDTQPSVDGSMLYVLKESVEEQLAELKKQKETITFLMMRVEGMMKTQNTKESEMEINTMHKDQDHALSEKDLERTRLHNEIYALYDQGMAVDEISKQVSKGKGEVKLILNLRN